MVMVIVTRNGDDNVKWYSEATIFTLFVRHRHCTIVTLAVVVLVEVK